MEAFEYKGMALREINEYEEAINIFKQALEIEKNNLNPNHLIIDIIEN